MNTVAASKARNRARTRQNREESRAKIVAAATEMVRERAYAELSIGEITDAAGIGRTLFYRHFDDLGDLLRQASGDAMGELFDAEVELSAAVQRERDTDAVRAAVEPAVKLYSRHGPLLRALNEAAAADPVIAEAQEGIRSRFDELVAESMSKTPEFATNPAADVMETARALNLLNTAYLLDAFGHEPRVSVETAITTLTEIWLRVIGRERS
jgi:AcrR family transcriptional regulator